MNNLLTAEEFIKNHYDWSSEDLERWMDKMSQLPMADANNVTDLMVEFAKLHVKAASKSYLETCKSKFYVGETGYLKQEDIELAYPLDNIK